MIVFLYKRPGDPKEYGSLYAIPATAFLGGYLATTMQVRYFILCDVIL